MDEGAARERMRQLVELEGDHTEAERAELHDGEENAFESVHLGIYWEDHDRRIVLKTAAAWSRAPA